MSRAARAPTPAPPPPNPPPSKPIVPPIKRHLAFVTTKPHFVPSDDYHRFSNTGRAADQEPGAIVVRPSVSKQRGRMVRKKMRLSPVSGLAYLTVPSTHLYKQKVEGYNKSKATRGNRSTCPILMSNAGSPYTLTPAGNCRYDSSFGSSDEKVHQSE